MIENLSKYTVTLNEALEYDSTLLDVLSSNDILNQFKFKERFISFYKIYEIGGETLPMFKEYINRCYNQYASRYIKLLPLVEEANLMEKPQDVKNTTKNDNIEDTGNGVDINYDLPNKQTDKEYPNNKNTSSGTYNRKFSQIHNETYTKGFNNIEQLEKINNKYVDLIQDFIYKFETCFISLM